MEPQHARAGLGLAPLGQLHGEDAAWTPGDGAAPDGGVEKREGRGCHARIRMLAPALAGPLPGLAVKPRTRRSRTVARPSLRRRIALVSIQGRSSRRGGRMRKTGRMVVAGAALMAVVGVSDRRVAGGPPPKGIELKAAWRVHGARRRRSGDLRQGGRRDQRVRPGDGPGVCDVRRGAAGRHRRSLRSRPTPCCSTRST